MSGLLVWPDPPPADLARLLDLGGFTWSALVDEAKIRAESWVGAIVCTDDRLDDGLAVARVVRAADSATPVLLLVRGSVVGDLDGHHDLFDDFCVTPFHPTELDARVRHVLARGNVPMPHVGPELVQYDHLALNLETYQAAIEGRPLDLTYMEYELLKFLVSNPGRVVSREQLLAQVWGYEYYGGARTVDVHIRRLRAKLGEEHAGLIQTVRSVGYRFGESRWSASA